MNEMPIFKLNQEDQGRMRGSIEIGEEIKKCINLIEDPAVPESVKEEMKLKKKELEQSKESYDNAISL